MSASNAPAASQDPGGTAMYSGDNGYAVSAPTARAMSHNRRTLQDVGAWPACIAFEAQTHAQERRTGVRMGAGLAHNTVGVRASNYGSFSATIWEGSRAGGD